MLSASLNKTFPSFLPSSDLSSTARGTCARTHYVITTKTASSTTFSTHMSVRLGEVLKQIIICTWNRLNKTSSFLFAIQNTKDTTFYLQPSLRRKEGNVLFNDALNTFYLRLYGVILMVKDHSYCKETRCRHMGYSFRLAARVILYASPHIQDNTYHGLCYTSRGALAGTRNSSMGPPHEGSIRRPIAP